MGHEVRTVADEGMSGAVNGAVHEKATSGYDLLITTDRDFRNPMKYPATPRTGVIFIRVVPMTAEKVVAALRRFLRDESLEAVRGRKLILRADDSEWAV